MNKRFWEIVEQADAEGGDDPDIRDQVFAQLIIKECAQVARHDAVRKMSGQDIAGMIEMHFGVEE